MRNLIKIIEAYSEVNKFWKGLSDRNTKLPPECEDVVGLLRIMVKVQNITTNIAMLHGLDLKISIIETFVDNLQNFPDQDDSHITQIKELRNQLKVTN